MSDSEFDELEDQLCKLYPENSYFSSVGILQPHGVKISHPLPMLSMAKAKNMDDVKTWLKRLAGVEITGFVLEPKIDGLSATCRYKNGKLVYVATRGDGEVGQDVTHIAEYVSDIPQIISFTKEEIEIRGELYLPRNTGYNTEGKPLRNSCVGLINRKENRGDLIHVRFAVYQIVGLEDITLESDRIKLLDDNRMNAVNYFTASDISEIEEYYNSYMNEYRDRWEYETDGLILSVDDRRLFEEIDSMWVVDHHHHYSIALKPPSQSRETKLRDIIWQVSRQGNLVPVALFEPVVIGGAKLERATLNNYENVIRLKVQRGDTLVVQRANDVIPFVQENRSSHGRTDFNDELVAGECPSCASRPVRSGVHIRCVNSACEEQSIQKIIYWVKSCDIENVAEATVRTLFSLGRIKNISELRASKKITLMELISRLAIPLVQKKSLVKLGISTVSDFISYNDDTYVIGRNIIDWKSDSSNMTLFNELLEVLELVEDTGGAAKGKVCMTGKGPGKRNELIKIIEDMGYEFSNTVTKDLEILICEDVNGKSSKLDNARKSGIKLMSYEEFFGDKIVDME
jgi:DNA ligase (NAD+)